MKVRAGIPLFLLIVVLSQGCAFSRGTLGDEINADAIATLHKGKTTKADVINLLGAPDDITAHYR